MKTKKLASSSAPLPSMAPESATDTNDKIWKDARFAYLVSDPRFKNIAKSTRAVKIDKRFQSMFNDDKFNVKYTVDKRGRPAGPNKSSASDLKKFYELSSDDDEEEEQRKELAAISKDDDAAQQVGDKSASKRRPVSGVDGTADDSQLRIDDADDEEIPSTLKDKLKDLTVDYARGESSLWSDDSSDDESSDEDGDGAGELFIEHVWGELDAEAPRTDDSTRRLAVCNMDWDRIRAVDIMVLCNSFLPPGGAILRVAIYPSEFGKERMAAEELKGPQELTEKTLSRDSDASDDGGDDTDSDADFDLRPAADDGDDGLPNEATGDDDDAEEGDDYNMEKLRQYQLNRLKYYYAVIECNNVAAADKIYAECDGMEYESTATKLDLRFVPDDMAFDGDVPKDVCTEMPDASKYVPRLFTTTALQQAKVELTWDENDLERKELNDKLAAGKLHEVGDQELRKYVAYSSEEEDEVEDADDTIVTKNKSKLSRNRKVVKGAKKSDVADDDEEATTAPPKKNDSLSKYKALLAEINEQETKKKNNQIEMEFSWGIGLKGSSSKQTAPNGDDDESDDESGDNAKPKADPEKTHFERIVELKAEKKKARKEEQKLKRKKYRNGGEPTVDDSGSEIGGNLDSDSDGDIPDGVDLNDPYFAEEFANGDFAAPKKKKSSKSADKKARRRDAADGDSDAKREQNELALLLDDGDDDDGAQRAHFSLKQIQDAENETKSKRKRKAVLRRSKAKNVADKELLHADDFKIDTGDERFQAIYSSHLFSIDPTHPNYKKTKAMDALIEAKLKRTPAWSDATQDNGEKPAAKKAKISAKNNMLVKSLKRKAQQ